LPDGEVSATLKKPMPLKKEDVESLGISPLDENVEKNCKHTARKMKKAK
jgi:hypothetical protein